MCARDGPGTVNFRKSLEGDGNLRFRPTVAVEVSLGRRVVQEIDSFGLTC